MKTDSIVVQKGAQLNIIRSFEVMRIILIFDRFHLFFFCNLIETIKMPADGFF